MSATERAITGWCWAHDHQDCKSATCECECHDDEPRRRPALAGEQPKRKVGCGAEGPLVSAPCIRLVHDDGKHDDGRGTRWIDPPVPPLAGEQ